ncbi:MAG: SulP family inorganic anion transporter [Gemmataceae bacterium]
MTTDTPSKAWRADLLAGFLVFLIALPLCLGISMASGYPPIAGIFTAIIGGVVTTFISNSELTIKGPAAGLIVITLGAIEAFGGGVGKPDDVNFQAYQLALGVGVAAGVIQLLLGLFKLGDVIGDFFPTSAVHGMLAAIGVIIAAKQIHVVLGVQSVKGGPFAVIAQIPSSFAHLNPEIAVIGLTSLLILFGLPMVKNRWVRMIPAPMLVLLVAVPLGLWFDLDHPHYYRFLGDEEYAIGPEYEVNLPGNFFDGVAMPNFSGLLTGAGVKFVIFFTLVGSLESLLSAKAIDLLDPRRRQTNLNRDLTAVGLANTLAALVGGLPMISEIVRSKANIDNGAQTRKANLFHGLFLLASVALIPGLLHHIPLAALAAMLVYTGCRLASPYEFVRAYKIGLEQLAIFLTTIVVTLAEDLLVGVMAGVLLKVLIHLLNGATVRSLVRPVVEVEVRDGHTAVVTVKDAAVFSGWIYLKSQLKKIDPSLEVVVDLSRTRLVDHTVMEKLHILELEYEHAGRALHVVGLEGHRRLSNHPYAARKKAVLEATGSAA